MAVCYMRPFTSSDLKIPNEYVPTSDLDDVAHSHLKTLRDKVYAHTDERGGRQIRDFQIEIEGEIVRLLAHRSEGASRPAGGKARTARSYRDDLGACPLR